MKKTVLAMLAVVAAGCASTPNYDAQLQPWVGRSQGELFADWGAPSEVMTNEQGATVLFYHQERSWQKRGVSMDVGGSYPGGDQPLSAGSGATTVIHYCNTFFVLGQDDRIASYNYEGDECPLQEAKRRPTKRLRRR